MSASSTIDFILPLRRWRRFGSVTRQDGSTQFGSWRDCKYPDDAQERAVGSQKGKSLIGRDTLTMSGTIPSWKPLPSKGANCES